MTRRDPNRVKLTPSEVTAKARAARKAIPKPYSDVVDKFPQLCDLIEELIPIGTACDLLGLDREQVAGYLGRSKAAGAEAKRRFALGMVALQRSVAEGGTGWQARMRLAESRDPGNWLRAAPTVSKTKSTYGAALQALRARSRAK